MSNIGRIQTSEKMTRRYLLFSVIMLLILGAFLTWNVISSRNRMLELLKDEAGSLLTMIALSQENSIFAEGKYEDAIIEKFIGVCDYLDNTSVDEKNLLKIRDHFDINSIYVARSNDLGVVAVSGKPASVKIDVLGGAQRFFFEYFDIAAKRHMRLIYRTNGRIYQIENSAIAVESFRQNFGINKFINQIAADPEIRYLVFQDLKGIIFATANVHSVTRIADDAELSRTLEAGVEAARIIDFNNEKLLELARPFIVEGVTLGIFRIGVSLQGYFCHVRATERQLIGIFFVLLAAGSIAFFFFNRYQRYQSLKEAFDKTLGAIEDGVMTVDRRGRITGTNRAFLDLLNLESKYLMMADYDMVFPGDPYRVNRALKESTKIMDEQTLGGKHLLFATYPFFDERRHASGAIVILRDTTRLREFEREREESERLRFLGNLVANFAHEIKNPLNGLSMAAQRMAKEFKLPDQEYERLLKIVLKEIGSLDKTLNDFLDLAHLRIRDKEPFSLTQVLADALDLVREQIRQTGIMLRDNIKSDMRIEGSADEVKRALLNILLNAVEAVSGIKERTPEILVETSATKGGYRIVINDNGAGMDVDEQSRIFAPYFTTKRKGTGLGLYIAQEILKRHRGSIRVESEKNRGTRFTIEFSRGKMAEGPLTLNGTPIE